MKTPLSPFVSVLLPTRKRLSMLTRCIQSIIDHAAAPEDVEFVVRIHRDDWETINAAQQLLKMGQVKIVIGYPFSGYDDLSRFYQDAAGVANGKYVWVMNDDVVVSGAKWDSVLGHAPEGCIIMPAIHRLGESVYYEDKENPFMFLPNKCWELYGEKYFGSPFDKSLWQLMRKHGWNTHYLQGVSVHHQREDDTTLLPSRIKDYKDAGHNEDHMENL